MWLEMMTCETLHWIYDIVCLLNFLDPLSINLPTEEFHSMHKNWQRQRKLDSLNQLFLTLTLRLKFAVEQVWATIPHSLRQVYSTFAIILEVTFSFRLQVTFSYNRLHGVATSIKILQNFWSLVHLMDELVLFHLFMLAQFLTWSWLEYQAF